MKTEKDNEQLLEIAIEQIANIDNENQYILNAHLIAESCLYKILENELPNAKALEKARFSFAQILAIAESLRTNEVEGWIWIALRHLNSLRNEIAHNLASSKLPDKRAAFLKSTNPWIDLDSPCMKVSQEKQFLIVLHILCSQLSKILNGEMTAGPCDVIELIKQNKFPNVSLSENGEIIIDHQCT